MVMDLTQIIIDKTWYGELLSSKKGLTTIEHKEYKNTGSSYCLQGWGTTPKEGTNLQDPPSPAANQALLQRVQLWPWMVEKFAEVPQAKVDKQESL